MYFTSAIAIAVLAATTEAALGERTFAVLRFRDNSLTSGRADPIVNPGQPSGHVHIIQGGNAFAMVMDDNTPSKSTCTSAQINNDLSNYWTPSLYFKDPKTGEIEAVEMFYQNVYYFFEQQKEKVHAFPKGLRMFVGDPSARTPPKVAGSILDKSQGTIQPIQWTCPRSDGAKSTPLYPPSSNGMNGVGIQDPGNDGQGVGFPDKECDGYASPLRADIHFPSCYNPAKGVRNYKENMEWPTNDKCPEGTLHVPHLFFEVYWNTPKFAGRWTPGQGKSPWVLSNGDVTGYALHGDFINGWDADTLQHIIDTCDAGSSGMDNCQGVPGGITRDGSCKLNNLVPETIFGKMKALPGGNTLGKWGVPGSGGGGGGGSAPAASPTKGTTTKVASPVTTKAAGGNPVKPSTKALTKPASPTSPPKPNNPAGPVYQPTKSAGAPTKPAPAPTRGPVKSSAGSPLGGSNTLVTSYISETVVVVTTVTLPGAAPTGGSGVKAGLTYKGCFSDDRFKRVLSGIEFANVGHKQVTNTKCVAYCEARGFKLAGTEFGGQCFCGNELKGSKSLAEATCDMPCEGDAKQMCGGGLALSVYDTKAKKVVGRDRRALPKNRHQHMHARSN